MADHPAQHVGYLPVTVILWEPQDPINIGSVVRVCRNTGVRDLRLIRPAGWIPERVAISAPNSDDWVRDHVRIHESWDDAVSGLHRLYALTARGRLERQQRFRLDPLVQQLRPELEQGAGVGFVFGREDSGLPNSVVDRCDAYVTLETHPDYTSLNLAQAVLLVCHHLFRAFGEADPMRTSGRRFDDATHDQVARMMDQVERSLDAIAFFKGDQRENVLRTIQRVVLRARPDQQELATLWGIFSEVERAARIEQQGASGQGATGQEGAGQGTPGQEAVSRAAVTPPEDP